MAVAHRLMAVATAEIGWNVNYTSAFKPNMRVNVWNPVVLCEPMNHSLGSTWVRGPLNDPFPRRGQKVNAFSYLTAVLNYSAATEQLFHVLWSKRNKDQDVKVHTALGLNIIHYVLYPSFTSILCAQCGLHVKEKAALSADILRGAGHWQQTQKNRLLNNALKDPVCYMKALSDCVRAD